LALLVVLAPVGCTARLRGPALGPLYDQAARYLDEHRNPVIVIPGILGSRLRDEESGRVVWGAFAGSYANPETPDGARLVGLPMIEGVPLADLRDGVTPNGVLDRLKVSLVGLPVELNAYLYILGTLGVGGYRDELLARAGAVDYGGAHFTCFQFDFDWRRDNVENARRLHQYILEKRAYVQREIERRFGTPDADVQFDIVAHSMGGLIARYYLMYGDVDLPADGSAPNLTWAGAAFVHRAVLVGTPNAGSVKAVTQLVEGATFAPVLPTFGPAVIGTVPSVYQLMPRTRHRPVVDGGSEIEAVDIYDPSVWERMQWGLASPKVERTLSWLMPGVSDPAERHRVAREHQRKCLERARAFAEALDRPADPPRGLELHLFAADSQPTDAVATVRPNGRLRITERRPGDGTVLRSSALMDERQGQPWEPGLKSPIAWTDVTFVFADHLGMTHNPVFTDNLLFLLLERDRQGPGPPVAASDATGCAGR
jgi:hypothetical protein